VCWAAFLIAQSRIRALKINRPALRSRGCIGRRADSDGHRGHDE